MMLGYIGTWLHAYLLYLLKYIFQDAFYFGGGLSPPLQSASTNFSDIHSPDDEGELIDFWRAHQCQKCSNKSLAASASWRGRKHVFFY